MIEFYVLLHVFSRIKLDDEAPVTWRVDLIAISGHLGDQSCFENTHVPRSRNFILSKTNQSNLIEELPGPLVITQVTWVIKAVLKRQAWPGPRSSGNWVIKVCSISE